MFESFSGAVARKINLKDILAIQLEQGYQTKLEINLKDLSYLKYSFEDT